MNQQRHLFTNQSITKSHWTRAHNPSPQQSNYSLVINIYIIKLHNKALDIRKRESRDEGCSMKCSLAPSWPWWWISMPCEEFSDPKWWWRWRTSWWTTLVKDGGGEEVWKWQNRAAQPCVDRSSTLCRPVDRGAEANPKGKGGERKGERKSEGFWGWSQDTLMRQILSYL